MTTSVFDLQAFDRSVRPQDDLFRFVNGTWLANATIPDDKATTGAFIELRDQAEEAVRNIITQAKPDA
ncbi:MAG: peptidase M13, partial [Kocuria sp.]|nr:peptidase M13 [Kocuria sp.]MDN5701275.1 peptidase M13 [Kocuria sp.]